jgi:hypothetical protein
MNNLQKIVRLQLLIGTVVLAFGCGRTDDAIPGSNAHPTGQSVAADAATPAMQAAITRFDFTPLGQPDCDAFLMFAKQCFANAKQRGVEVIIDGYADGFKNFRGLVGKPEYKETLATICRQQLDGREQLRASLLC